MRILILLAALLSTNAIAANDDYTFGIYYLCCSEHGPMDSDATNEVHNGLGLTLTLPESDSITSKATFGITSYTNSHDKQSIMISVSKEFWNIADEVHIGLGAGIASGYQDHLSVPAAAWVSARYKWVVVTHVPLAVTTLGFHIPFN